MDGITRTIDYPSPCTSVVTWTISAEMLDGMLRESEADLQKEWIGKEQTEPPDWKKKGKRKNRSSARKPTNGFRPGRLSKEVLWNKFGKTIKQKAVGKLIPLIWKELSEDNPFKPVAHPYFDGIPEPGKDFVLTATFKILPSSGISPDQYQNLSILIQADEPITEDIISQAVEFQRRYHARYTPAKPEDIVNVGDFVSIRFQERSSETGEWSPEETAQIVLGQGSLNPVVEQHLLGTKKKHGKGFVLQRADGMKIECKLFVDDHKTGVLPTDEELCVKEKVSDIEELRSRIQRQMTEQAADSRRTRIRQALMRKIMDGSQFPVPEEMVSGRAAMIEKEARIKAMKSGLQFDQSDDARRKIMALAEMLVREEIVLEEIYAQEGISVSNDDIATEIDKIARRDQQSVEELTEWIEKAGLWDNIHLQCRWGKTLDWLIERTKVNEEITIS